MNDTTSNDSQSYCTGFHITPVLSGTGSHVTPVLSGTGSHITKVNLNT